MTDIDDASVISGSTLSQNSDDQCQPTSILFGLHSLKTVKSANEADTLVPTQNSGMDCGSPVIPIQLVNKAVLNQGPHVSAAWGSEHDSEESEISVPLIPLLSGRKAGADSDTKQVEEGGHAGARDRLHVTVQAIPESEDEQSQSLLPQTTSSQMKQVFELVAQTPTQPGTLEAHPAPRTTGNQQHNSGADDQHALLCKEIVSRGDSGHIIKTSQWSSGSISTMQSTRNSTSGDSQSMLQAPNPGHWTHRDQVVPVRQSGAGVSGAVWSSSGQPGDTSGQSGYTRSQVGDTNRQLNRTNQEPSQLCGRDGRLQSLLRTIRSCPKKEALTVEAEMTCCIAQELEELKSNVSGDDVQGKLPALHLAVASLIELHKTERESLAADIRSSQRSSAEKALLRSTIQSLASRQQQVFSLFKTCHAVSERVKQTEGSATPLEGRTETEGASMPLEGCTETEGSAAPLEGCTETEGSATPLEGRTETEGSATPLEGCRTETEGASTPEFPTHQQNERKGSKVPGKPRQELPLVGQDGERCGALSQDLSSGSWQAEVSQSRALTASIPAPAVVAVQPRHQTACCHQPDQTRKNGSKLGKHDRDSTIPTNTQTTKKLKLTQEGQDDELPSISQCQGVMIPRTEQVQNEKTNTEMVKQSSKTVSYANSSERPVSAVGGQRSWLDISLQPVPSAVASVGLETHQLPHATAVRPCRGQPPQTAPTLPLLAGPASEAGSTIKGISAGFETCAVSTSCQVGKENDSSCELVTGFRDRMDVTTKTTMSSVTTRPAGPEETGDIVRTSVPDKCAVSSREAKEDTSLGTDKGNNLITDKVTNHSETDKSATCLLNEVPVCSRPGKAVLSGETSTGAIPTGTTASIPTGTTASINLQTSQKSLFSPPRAVGSGNETDVSPTATSMSSDIFLVKTKELNKRIKQRAVLPQFSLTVGSQGAKVKLQTPTTNAEPREATFIKPSNCDQGKKPLEVLPGSQLTGGKATPGKKTAFPSLKELLDLGKLTPGRDVLSTQARSKPYRATLTPKGHIRGAGGEEFRTPMSWLSALLSGAVVKKVRAYNTVLYKGQPLSSLCSTQAEDRTATVIPQQSKRFLGAAASTGTFRSPAPTPVPALVSPDTARVKPGSVSVADKAVSQARKQPSPYCSSQEQGMMKDTETLKLSQLHQAESNSHSEDKLKELLSGNCRVRLIGDVEIIPCDDLPDNFWSDDFSAVKLDSDIWDCVCLW